MSDSQSPSKEVGQGAQSPEDEGQMNDTQDPQAGGLAGYEFEGVKEQDRWLPIANGRPPPPHRRVLICPSLRAFSTAVHSWVVHVSRFAQVAGAA